MYPFVVFCCCGLSPMGRAEVRLNFMRLKSDFDVLGVSKIYEW
jgi:hypothetical protein